jgi:hypothetical protein
MVRHISRGPILCPVPTSPSPPHPTPPPSSCLASCPLLCALCEQAPELYRREPYHGAEADVVRACACMFVVWPFVSLCPEPFCPCVCESL